MIKRMLRKTGIAIAGVVLLIIGVILLALPGPGLATIALGLFVLSLEFDWADKYFKRFEGEFKKLRSKSGRFFRKNKNT